MSEPSVELRAALEPWFRADAGVVASFGSNPVKVYSSLPPVSAVAPYIFIAGFFVEDEAADCYAGTIVNLQVDVWSLMQPKPGFSEAETIVAAVKAALTATEDTGATPTFTLASYRVVAVELVSTNYLTDPSDGKTVHAVIAARLSVDPI